MAITRIQEINDKIDEYAAKEKESLAKLAEFKSAGLDNEDLESNIEYYKKEIAELKEQRADLMKKVSKNDLDEAKEDVDDTNNKSMADRVREQKAKDQQNENLHAVNYEDMSISELMSKKNEVESSISQMEYRTTDFDSLKDNEDYNFAVEESNIIDETIKGRIDEVKTSLDSNKEKIQSLESEISKLESKMNGERLELEDPSVDDRSKKDYKVDLEKGEEELKGLKSELEQCKASAAGQQAIIDKYGSNY